MFSSNNNDESAAERILRKAQEFLGEAPSEQANSAKLASVGNKILSNKRLSSLPSSHGKRSLFVVPGLGLGDPNLTSARPGELEVTCHFLDQLCFALYQSGHSPIQAIAVLNESPAPTRGLQLRVSIEPNFASTHKQMIPAIAPGDTWTTDAIALVPNTERLQAVTETSPAHLHIEVLRGEEIFHGETLPMDVLPFNHWYAGDLSDYFVATLALFVTPNASEVQDAMNRIGAQLQCLGAGESLDGYQANNPDKVVSMVESVFLTLRDDYEFTYINPPASFEDSGQKIRLASDLLTRRRGTCLDLTLLLASMIESMGLDPLIVVMPGHAFAGVWLVEDGVGYSPNVDEIPDLVEQGALLLFNSTTMTNREVSFQDAVKETIEFQPLILSAISVSHARAEGLKPAF